ncbi:hypothetical protein P4114_02615 [Pseudomonas aeruginosa]|nr:hypothetical protein [Pseudomonas aeruginosa]
MRTPLAALKARLELGLREQERKPGVRPWRPRRRTPTA